MATSYLGYKTTWGAYKLKGNIHVCQESQRGFHEQKDCWCKPKIKIENKVDIIVHNMIRNSGLRK